MEIPRATATRAVAGLVDVVPAGQQTQLRTWLAAVPTRTVDQPLAPRAGDRT